MRSKNLLPDVIPCNATIGACGTVNQSMNQPIIQLGHVHVIQELVAAGATRLPCTILQPEFVGLRCEALA